MKTTYLFLAVIAANLYISASLPRDIDIKGKLPDGHIIGGTETSPHAYPWQVYLITHKSIFSYSCGATYIGKNWILTAAHCVLGYKSVDLTFGAHNIKEKESTQKMITADECIVHPKYSGSDYDNDIAVCYFKDDLPENDIIHSIPLANKDPEAGSDCMITGWGITSDQGQGTDVLMEVEVHIETDKYCKEEMSHMGDLAPDMDNYICLDTRNGKSPCSGDSGGPMHVVENGVTKVAGITSFGAHPECEIGGPEAYTSVEAYLDWIKEVTKIKP